MLISREMLKHILELTDKRLKREVEVLLVGGGALLVLAKNSTATRDLDALPTDTLSFFQDALRKIKGEIRGIDLNTRSVGFESYLPDGWEERTVLSKDFSTANIKVYTPCPEDLAVMKVFRFSAKDAQDIARLAGLPRFKPSVFKKRFLSVLPAAVGDPRWHAQSFSMIWNSLYPKQSIDTDDVIKLAGLERAQH
jgi:hypothetical protein